MPLIFLGQYLSGDERLYFSCVRSFSLARNKTKLKNLSLIEVNKMGIGLLQQFVT